MTQGELSIGGRLTAKVIRCPGPGLGWKLRNSIRWAFIWGLIANWLARLFSRITKIPTITAELEALLIRADGQRVNYGVVGRRYVTDDGVAFLVDDWDDDSTDITNMNYHASGTDNTAENQTDSDLGAEATSVTDRVAGTKSQPAAYQLRSIGTQSFTGSAAIVEHGLFSVITESAGVLWDRTVFTVINVGNGDSIQWTYTCTLNAGS